MKSTITAVFESLDMAEIAARKLRHAYPQLYDIKIKYNNNGYSSYENSALIPALPIGSSTTFSSTTLGFGSYSYGLANVTNDYTERNIVEPTNSTKSKIIIKADESAQKAIAATLTSMGGLQVNSINLAIK